MAKAGIHRLKPQALVKHPPEKAVNDGGGLWLDKARNGLCRAYHHSGQGDLPLGVNVCATNYETCRDTLLEARRRNDAVRAEKAQGLDPWAERARREQEALAAQRLVARTVGQAVTEFVAAQPWSEAARKVFRRRFEIHMHALADRPVAAVNIEDAERELARVQDLRMREQVRRELARVFRREIAKGHRSATLANPCDGGILHDRLGAYRHHTTHQPALPLHQQAEACIALAEKGKATASAALFCILCAARPVEVTRATWGEIDLDHALWCLPGSKTKNGREHVVPLSAWAVELLRAVRPADPKPTDLVWLRCRKPMSVESLCRMLAVVSYEGVSLHGTARANFRSWCGEVGIEAELAEKALNHTPPGIVATYQRSALVERRKPVMERWAQFCRDGKMPTAAIVPFRAMTA